MSHLSVTYNHESNGPLKRRGEDHKFSRSERKQKAEEKRRIDTGNDDYSDLEYVFD
jgi:hypothetical protein